MLTVAASIAAVYLALLAIVYVAQGSLIYYPQMGREVAATPVAHGLEFEELALKTEDGETLHAWWVPARDSKRAVLLFHGNAGNISHRLDYARMFHDLGYATLLLEYRGYGKSTGTPSEQGTYRDALTAWQWLTVERRLSGEHIVIFGESLGGAVGTWLAAQHAPRALVLASTFTSVPDLGAQVYWFIPVRLLARYRYETLKTLPQVHAPVLVAHSRDDDIIPYAHGQKLFGAANAPKQFLDLAGGHNDGFVYMRPQWVKALAAFLDGLGP